MEGGNVIWNREVTSQERATAISKLQRFLLSVVGDGPDAVNRATDLANKFEQRVFTTTSTREEYSRVIVARMQQVQLRRKSMSEEVINHPTAHPTGIAHSHSFANVQNSANPHGHSNIRPPPSPNMELPPLELSEHDKTITQQKVARLVAFLPTMERILTKCSSPNGAQAAKRADPDALRRYTQLKQAAVIPKKIFILSVTAATMLIDQIQHYTNVLSQVVGETANPRIVTAVKSTVKDDTLDDYEKTLVSWIKGRRAPESSDLIVEDVSRRAILSSQQHLDHSSMSLTERMLEEEISNLAERKVDLILERHPYGFAVQCRFGNDQIGILLPPEYPSERYSLTAMSGGCESLVQSIISGELQIFKPVSLTTLVSLFIRSL